MKRSRLTRRTALSARGGLQSTGGGLRRSKRLTSRTGPDEAERRAVVRRAVFDRDGRRCLLEGVAGVGRCFGDLTFHHRLKASQGGAYDEANGATLCAHHNDLIEADADVADIAAEMGLVIRLGRVDDG